MLEELNMLRGIMGMITLVENKNNDSVMHSLTNSAEWVLYYKASFLSISTYYLLWRMIDLHIVVVDHRTVYGNVSNTYISRRVSDIKRTGVLVGNFEKNP